MVGAEAVDASIIPDIRPVAASLARAGGVQLLCAAKLVVKDQLVTRPIERAHAAVGLGPDHEALDV